MTSSVKDPLPVVWSATSVQFSFFFSVALRPQRRDYRRDSSVVRAPDSWLKGRGFESQQERRENVLLQGQPSVQVSVPPPCVARKRSRSFCRWQVIAKHAYTLTYMPLHEVTWCMVVWCTQNLRRDGNSFMWHQPCQRCKYTTSVDI